MVGCFFLEVITDGKKRPTRRAGGLGGTRRARTAVAAKAFFRFVGWFSHQAANASRWAVLDGSVKQDKIQEKNSTNSGCVV
jgi:hypothetical protein